MAGDLQKNKTQTREAFFLDGSLPDFADIMCVQICWVENSCDCGTYGTALVIKGLCKSEEQFNTWAMAMQMLISEETFGRSRSRPVVTQEFNTFRSTWPAVA